MHKQYYDLFSLIAHSTANVAEVAMGEHQDNNEIKEFENAQKMRDDYLDLKDKIDAHVPLNKIDYSRLLIGTIIVINQIEARIKQHQTAVQGYKLDLIPKLQQLTSKDVEDVNELAEKLFQIQPSQSKEIENN